MLPDTFIYNDRLINRLEGRKILICLKQLRQIASPDNTMCRGNHINVKIHIPNLLQLIGNLHTIRHHDICIVILCAINTLGSTVCIIKDIIACNVLSERIIGEYNFLLCDIGQHIIRPVNHRHFHKRKRIAPGGQGITGFHPLKIIAFEILLQHDAHTGIAGIRSGIGIILHKFQEASGMIRLCMLYDNIVNGSLTDYRTNTLHHRIIEFFLNSINQCHLLIDNQIGIIGRPFCDRKQITVKMTAIEIMNTDPVHIFFHLYCLFHFLHLWLLF